MAKQKKETATLETAFDKEALRTTLEGILHSHSLDGTAAAAQLVDAVEAYLIGVPAEKTPAAEAPAEGAAPTDAAPATAE